MKIVTVIGVRPQFVKAAVVSRLLRATPGCEEILVHTGQHYDEKMSDVFFQELQLPQARLSPPHGLRRPGGRRAECSRRSRRVLLETRPDKLMIYGDTNSTLAGAWPRPNCTFPIAHVEAGVRSFNRKMPEEVNRIAADHLSAWLFAPTEAAVDQSRQGRHRAIR